MIKYEVGDMFKSQADCLVNTVNCEGYMGKGIAYQFKMKFLENNKDYIKACKNGSLHIGSIHYFVENGTTIINFPTKDKWREDSKMSYIDSGLDAFLALLPSMDVKTIAIPPLGCGNGGLDWNEVKELLVDKLSVIENKYNFIIYEPSKNYKQKVASAPKLSVSSLVLMQMKMNLKKCTKLRLQKTAYFMDIFLKEHYFKFQKYKYGPYAHSIDIISKDIREYQSFYGLKDTKSSYEMVYQVICSDKTTKALEKLSSAILKATKFVNQIEADEDLEGIASVLYLIETGKDNSLSDLIKRFQGWSEDKSRCFSEVRIRDFIEYLVNAGIIEIDLIGNYHISNYI